MCESMKTAFITGITGQDGSYLAEYLLSLDYQVHGIIRRASSFNTPRIAHIFVDPHEEDARLHLHYGDLSDSSLVAKLIYKVKPDEVYHLGAQSHVRVSFDMPEYTGDITALGTTRILDAIYNSGNEIKFYQASSSEMFGAAPPPQSEASPFMPRSPYACAKLYSHWMTKNYREGYGIFASCGILFNHESPRRGGTFVTRKITRAIAYILAGRQDKLYLGNLAAKRDWGFAPEYVMLMWKRLQKDRPDDYVVGVGETHSVQEFLDAAFEYAGLDVDEHVEIDKRYFRPNEVEKLIADPSKAREHLGWDPKIGFDELVKIMVDADLKKVGMDPIGEGDKLLDKHFPNRWWKID
jgi:GDPmannose 4,6-dehydratase